MFKPLLRTLPSLSGNFTLNCYINEYDNVEDNKYNVNIRNAKLTPINNNIYNNLINVNLLNGKYEYDISNYFKYYNDSFYKNDFLFNRIDYQKINYIDQNSQRNKIFEYGVTRQNFSETNYQYNFYAPIYIDNINSLPDSFQIHIKINESKEKIINININNETNKNYLYIYLKRYIEKIDDKVIYCLYESNQGTYYGINVLNGGILELKDNNIGSLYNYQYTISNFDNILCDGFKRNNLIMKQVIPLSFSFNLNDILSEKEFKELKYSPITISGNYIKNGIKVDFYDFNINYTNFKYRYKEFDLDKGEFVYKNSLNVMDIGFPSLNEKRFYKYKYSNKLSPKYCKWKLKFSDDEFPYITNINFAFSKGQNSNYKYGNFPSLINLNNPKAKINNDNLVLPIKDDLMYYTNTNEPEKFKNFLNNNISNWYNLIDNVNNIFDEDSLWSNVTNNYVFFNDILYNLNNLSNDENNIDINKFGIFIKLNMTSSNIENNIKTKFLISYNDLEKNCNIDDNIEEKNIEINCDKLLYYNNIFNYEGFETFNGNRKLISDVDLIYDINGNICKLDNYYDINKYYEINNIYNIIKILYPDNYAPFIYNLNSFLKNYIIDSYKKLNIDNINNFVIKTNDSYKYIIDKSDEDLEIQYNNLYISDNTSGIKYKLTDKNYNLDLFQNNYTFLLKTKFISNENFIQCIYNCMKAIFDNSIITVDRINKIINMLDIYNYIPVFDNENGYLLYNYFECVNNDMIIDDYIKSTDINRYNDYIYVDSYSLYNFIKSYNDLNDSSINIEKILNKYKRNIFCKFISVNHIKEYFNSLYKDEYLNEISNIKENYLNYIYINDRIIIGASNDLFIKDRYVKLNEIEFFKNINFNDFINNLSFENNEFIYSEINDSDPDNIIVKKYYLDLYFNKDMYLLSDELLSISNILNINEINRVPLYLYKKIDNSNISKLFKIYDKPINNEIITNISNTCEPLFSNIYKSNDSLNELYELFNRNIIQSFYIDEDIYYKYVKYNSVCYIEVDRIDYIKDQLYNVDDFYNYLLNSKYEDINNLLNIYNINNSNDLTYEIKDEIIKYILNDNKLTEYIVKELNIQLYKRYDPLQISLIKDSTNNVTYDEEYNINKYVDENGIIYGYYLINVNFSNDNKSINILDDSPNIFKFSKINGIDIFNNENYIVNIFNLINPFLKKILFLEFINLVNTVVKPSMFTLNVNYYPIIYDNGNTDNSHLYDGIFYNINNEIDTDKSVYDIKYYNSNSKKMYLNRYLNYITPLITKTNIIENVGNLKFKTFDKKVNSNNIYISDLNIYKYNGVKYINTFNTLTDKNPVLLDYNEVEYKHFNDNKYYIIEPEIIINLPNNLTYNELLEYETKSMSLKYFKKYINLYENYNLEDNEILFLFNRYKINYLSKSIKLNSFKTIKLYNLTYKFTLK